MIETILCTKSNDHIRLREHLFNQAGEGAAFIYVKPIVQNRVLILEAVGYKFIQSKDFVDSSYYGLELKLDVWNEVIVAATKLNAHIVEIHSHPFSESNTGFSDYDLSGFKELVPHIWWRFNKGPYLALVYGQNDFDALLWAESPYDPQRLKYILLDNGKKLKPTDKTITMIKKEKIFYEDK